MCEGGTKSVTINDIPAKLSGAYGIKINLRPFNRQSRNVC